MLYLNGTRCVVIRRFQLVFLPSTCNQRRLINVSHPPPRIVKGRGDSGCWVHQMSRWEAAIRQCDNDKSQQPQRQLNSPFLSLLPSPNSQSELTVQHAGQMG